MSLEFIILDNLLAAVDVMGTLQPDLIYTIREPSTPLLTNKLIHTYGARVPLLQPSVDARRAKGNLALVTKQEVNHQLETDGALVLLGLRIAEFFVDNEVGVYTAWLKFHVFNVIITFEEFMN
jgi:hypothetical protein